MRSALALNATDLAELAQHLYWDAAHRAVRSLVNDGTFAGAIKVEELHVESFLPLVMLPHYCERTAVNSHS